MGLRVLKQNKDVAVELTPKFKAENRLHKLISLVVATGMLLSMTGCAKLPENKTVESDSKQVESVKLAEPANQTDADNQPPELDNLNLNAQTMFEIMAAELMLKRGQPKAAFDVYYPVAAELRKPELGERAFQISMSTYDMASIEKATKLWREVSPQSASAWRASFLLSLRNGKVDTALQEWEKFQTYSKSSLANNLIESANKIGASSPKDYGQVFLQKLVEKYPHEWSAYYALGMVSAIYQDPKVGIPALTKAKQLLDAEGDDNSDSLIYSLLSKLYMSVEPASKGVEALRPYVEKNPDDLLVQERLARLEVQAQMYEAAEARYQFIVDKEPSAYSSQFALALLQIERRAFDKAEQNLLKVSKSKGYQSIAFYYLGIMYQEYKKYDQAKTYFEKVKTPGYILDAKLHIAEIYYIEENKQEALAIIDALKPESNADKIKILRAQAIFATNENQFDLAVDIYEQALQIEPNNLDVIRAQSVLLYNQKKFDRYETLLMKAIKIDENDGSLLNALGYFYVEQNTKLDQAYALLKRALELEPNSFYILDSMGWYYYQLGNYPKSIEFLNKSFNQTQDAEVFMHLVKAHWANGQKQKAISLWKKYHQNYDTNDQVQNIIKDLEKTQ